MPAIYKGKCSECDYESQGTSGGYRAILMDEPSDSRHVHPTDKRLIILAHPVESLILEEIGIKDSEALLMGRTISVTVHFCNGCGSLTETRELLDNSNGSYGCLTNLFVSITTGVVVGFATNHVAYGMIAGFATVYVIHCS